jgi:thioredoxin-related protein
MKSIRLLLLVSLLPSIAHTAPAWLMDFPKAQSQARSEKKAMLVDFTGSDWCGWCIRLQREVFSKPEFDEYARKNLVLVEVDFPKRKTQSAAQLRANRALAQRFGVQSYPTLVVLDSSGKELGRLGYEPGGPKPFLARLSKLTGAAVTTEPASVAAMKKAEASIKESVMNRAELGTEVVPMPAKTATPANPSLSNLREFDDLVLKGISGTKQKRLAMINNQTLGAGEVGTVRVSGKSMQIRCEEIHEQSVVVSWNRGQERRELKFRP